jgi:hypothetical protein
VVAGVDVVVAVVAVVPGLPAADAGPWVPSGSAGWPVGFKKEEKDERDSSVSIFSEGGASRRGLHAPRHIFVCVCVCVCVCVQLIEVASSPSFALNPASAPTREEERELLLLAASSATAFDASIQLQAQPQSPASSLLLNTFLASQEWTGRYFLAWGCLHGMRPCDHHRRHSRNDDHTRRDSWAITTSMCVEFSARALDG